MNFLCHSSEFSTQALAGTINWKAQHIHLSGHPAARGARLVHGGRVAESPQTPTYVVLAKKNECTVSGMQRTVVRQTLLSSTPNADDCTYIWDFHH